MKKHAIIWCLIFSLPGFAQVNLDSLWNVWKDPSQPDTNRMKAMVDFSWDGYLFSKPDSAFYYAQQLYDFAKEKGHEKYQAAALNTQGASFNIRGNYSEAIRYFMKSLEIKKRLDDKKGIASAYINIGLIYKSQGDLAKGIDYYTKGLKMYESIGDKRGMAFALNNIGAVYVDQKNTDKALEYYQKSLNYFKEIGERQKITSIMNNISGIWQTRGDLEKAEEYLDQSMKIQEESEDAAGVANTLINKGLIRKEKKELEEALALFERSLKIREEISDKRGIAMSSNYMGDIYFLKDDYVKAISYSKRALDLAKEVGVTFLIEDASRSLYNSYKKTGKYQQALDMFRLSIAMRDSLQSIDNRQEVIRQEMQYNFEKQKALDEKEHEKQMAIAAEQEQKQKVMTNAVAAGLLLVIIFAVFVFNRLRVTRRQKNIIEHQKALVEEKQKEILDSITYARRLQDAILPTETVLKKYLPESFIFYKPKDIVAGDFYWMEPLTEDVILIAAADCTGHGVPGAMVSVVCSNALNRSVLEFGIKDPGGILDKTRELVLETFAKSDKEVKDGMDISLAAINTKTAEVKWAGANNPLWFYGAEGMKDLAPDKQPIGKSESPRSFTTQTISLKKGDMIFLITDGYADQFGGEKGKKFKYKPLKELLSKNASLSPDQQKERLEQALSSWKGTLEQVDDVCIIGVRL